MNGFTRFFVIAAAVILLSSSLGMAQTAPARFTSLVIDARGIEVERCMSPKILSDKNYEIYGTIFKDIEKLFEIGVVMYAPTLDEARKFDNARVGNNPMLVKALRTEGPASSDIVVADEEARRILEENKKAGFLEKYRVIVLINEASDSDEEL